MGGVHSAPSPWYPADIIPQLEPRLSGNAHIYFPGSANFTAATTRWSALDAPTFTVIVEPASEEDVVQTVLYANENNVPFLAVNGGHGAISSLGSLHNGIEIWMNQLDSVSIAEDGQTATFGGGTLSKQVTDALWAQNKQTVTGACECTSVVGPSLGGGHGFLQGWHGLIADQFVSLNMVLANGQLITVNESSDLWWAVRGAGHNFGIVTSITSKIYDVPDNGIWAYEEFIFTSENVEGLYDAINENLLKNGTQPADVMQYSFFYNDPSIDPDNSLIVFFILRQGVTAVESEYSAPFQALGPVTSVAGSGLYTDLPEWTGNADTSAPCQELGLVNVRFPVDVLVYNSTAQRLAYNMFSNATHTNTAFNGSLFLFEGYSTEAVQNVSSSSTAYANRAGNLLISPLITYAPAYGLDAQAEALGDSLRQIIFEGSGQSEMYSYVNYAYGNEGAEAWYGYEPWRLEQLRALKAKYDPKNAFSYYAPFA